MFNAAPDLSSLANLLAAFAFSAFALYFAWRLRSGNLQSQRVTHVFLAAVACSALWAWLNLASSLGGDMRLWSRESQATLSEVLAFAELLRCGLWYGFVLLLLRPASSKKSSGELRWMRGLALLTLAASAALLIAQSTSFVMADLARVHALLDLLRAVFGLLLVEQLLRNVDEAARWNAKPVCLGLGLAFAFDIFIYSQAALFRTFDNDALSVRAAVHALGLPLLFVASRRQADWLGKLHVSRAAVFHSATLLLVGAYLLLVSGLGYYVRYSGGDWGRALQMALMAVALLALALLLLSGSLRSRLRVYISKNFFSYRYDYREEWLRFTTTLSSGTSPQDMGVTVIRALANLVESPAGALWLLRSGELAQAARWNVSTQTERDGVATFAEFLRRSQWIVDLDEVRSGKGAYADLQAPPWLLADSSTWLAVPLLVGSEMIGFVLLSQARAKVDINWEVRDLLKTAASQASSYLAQMQAAEALLESRKFDAFNKMSAFVVHDLKNIVTQLSLMLKNAQRLRDNPEFQQDMLDTVENSLEKMRQLMLQLREGDKPHGVSSGVDLEAIAQRLAKAAHGKGRTLELQLHSKVRTRGHDERVERVIGHVVQNAFDATAPDKRVSLRLDQSGSQACVEVADQGCGMSPEFIQNRLFKPFETTKASGMGIGAYESYQYLQELGGKITVESKLHEGTTVTILLPLFHAATHVDSSMIGAK